MREKKILFNACMFTKNPPGVGINTREAYNALTSRLDEKGIKYKVYAYATEGLKNKDVVSLIRLPWPLEVLFKGFISVHRLIWNIFYLPILAKNYDLVYSFTSYGSPFIKKQVITVHDLICFQYPKQNKFQYVYFKTILPSIIRACKKVVVISNFTQQDVHKNFKIDVAKLPVIYCGHDHLTDSKVDSDERELEELENITHNKKFFFTAGASYGHKNVDKIIEAMQALPEYLLIITGPDNTYYRDLKKLTQRKNYNNIIFLNYVSDSFLKLLYKKCIANVYISSYEGFGSTPLEAAMNNKISIVANKSVLPEIYGDAVMYVDPAKPQEVTNALLSVLTTNFDRTVYENKFPHLIKKYSWGNMADGIMKVIIQCLN